MGKYYVCLELGGTHLRLGIVAEDFSLLRFEKLPTARLSDARDKAGCLAELLRPLIDEVGRENVIAVSMALASLMNKERSIVYSSPMVCGFDNIALKALLEERPRPARLSGEGCQHPAFVRDQEAIPAGGRHRSRNLSGNRSWQCHLH